MAVSLTTIQAAACCGVVAVGLAERGDALGDLEVLATNVAMLVPAFVMLRGIAFLAILVAAITSTFVAREECEQHAKSASKRKLGKKRAGKNGSTLTSMISLLVWIGSRG